MFIVEICELLKDTIKKGVFFILLTIAGIVVMIILPFYSMYVIYCEDRKK